LSVALRQTGAKLHAFHQAHTTKEETMAKSKKRQRLEEAGLLDPKGRLSKEQSTAVDSLTPEEVEAIISANKKLKNAFHLAGTTMGVCPHNTSSIRTPTNG
jgi:hypothetical protein